MYKELDDLYHEIALGIGMSDGEFSALYAISSLGDGCLQRDICREVYVSKQTINSAVRKLEKNGILYLEEKRGRDKKIFLQKRERTLSLRRLFRLWRWKMLFSAEMEPDERTELLRLSQKYIEYFREKQKRMLEDMK